MGAASMLVLIIAALAFAFIAILIARILTKATTNPQKGEPYECGIPTKGKTWKQFHVGYYLFAIVFLIFDVELIFLYPWAVAYDQLALFGLVEMVIFILTVFVAYTYVWRRGGLEWD